MAGITAETAQARLDAYLDAEAKVLMGQATEMDGRRLTRADLAAIQDGIRIWNARVVELSAVTDGGGLQVMELYPR